MQHVKIKIYSLPVYGAVYCSGRCFKGLFGIPFVTGALPNLRPRIASWTSVVLDRLGWLAGAKEYVRIAPLTTSMTAGYDGPFTGWNWASGLPARASAFSESDRASLPDVTKGGGGVGTFIARLVIFHCDWSSGSRVSSVELRWTFLQSLSS